ncbi:MAG: hypothetical protein U9N39_05805 [Campylobacterota bacterium]|nr:hypothetical protein [Campylobacterota bacterium]
MFKDTLDKEVALATAQIEELELTTHVVSPENTLSDMITFENASEYELNQRKLKKIYMRKRKLMRFRDLLAQGSIFTCMECGKDIELERLLGMPKARLCAHCAK